MGTTQFISTENKTTIIIADPHLESLANDVPCMTAFIRTLNPKDSILLFLGDLFHVWVGSPRYHTQAVKTLLDELSAFRSQGGTVCLTVGNRDLFFQETVSSADDRDSPFDAISLEFLMLRFETGLVMAHHGDLVNGRNKQYLLWRKFVRSSLTRRLFNLIPDEKWKGILWSLEKRIKATNKGFRNNFPVEEWTRYVTYVHQMHAPKLLVVGHFHPHRPIITQYRSTTAIVVPPWQAHQKYAILDPQLNFQFRCIDA
jgi:UDP-2,3-diacylglucosamine pyrophosphatase LpxH